MGSGSSTKYQPFSYKNWSTFKIDMNDIPLKFSDLEKDILQRNDLILTCNFWKEHEIKLCCQESDSSSAEKAKYSNAFMWNYCAIQKGIEQTSDIFKMIQELNDLKRELAASALEWKLFLQFWTGVLDDDATSEADQLLTSILNNIKKAIKMVGKVKVDNEASFMMKALILLREQKELLTNSACIIKLPNYLKNSITAFLYRKVDNYVENSKEVKPIVYMTHYLNTVDEEFEMLTKDRLQLLTKIELKKLRSKYWAVLKENKSHIDLDLNFIYKETSALINEMGQRRLPNINNLSLKKIEKSEKEFHQFLNNSCSYQISTLKMNECKVTTLEGETFESMLKMLKYNLTDALEFDSFVVSTLELVEMLNVCKNIQTLTFGALLGPIDESF